MEPKPERTFTVLSFLRPQPKQSVRFAAGGLVTWQPKEIVEAEKDFRKKVRDAMEEQGVTEPYLGEVRLEAVFYLPYASKEEAEWAEEGGVPDMASPPDVENLLKLVNDAAKGAEGLFLDDCQIAVWSVLKAYSPWIGFMVRYHCRDPAHPKQWAKRMAAYRRAVQGVARKQKKAREKAAEAARIRKEKDRIAHAMEVAREAAQ